MEYPPHDINTPTSCHVHICIYVWGDVLISFQELRTGMGMRQSFIRKPGTEQVLVRIGIGREGVFKVDGTENKVSCPLCHTDTCRQCT